MISKPILKAWQGDIVKFCEDAVWIPRPQGLQKLHLWDFQAQILREATTKQDVKPKYRVVCLSAPKRNGKTLLGALILAWRFFTTYNCQGIVCSNSFSQAQNVLFDTFRDIVRCSPILLKLVGTQNIFEDKVLLPETRSKVICLSAKVETSFGYPVTVACVDEIHASEDNGEGLFQILASQTADRDGQIILPSQASSRVNVLHRLYQVAKDDPDSGIYFYYTQKNLSPLITESYLKGRRAQMLPSQYRRFHLNEWGESEETLFTQEQVLGCLDDKFSLSGLRGYVLGAGLDRALSFSKNADKTILTFLAKGLSGKKEIYYVLDSKVIKFSEADSIKSALLEAQQNYGLNNLCSDVYQTSDLNFWALSQGFKSELLHLSRELQLSIFNLLYRIVNEGRLKFSPSFTLLKDELGAFGVDASVNPPKFGGHPHDDAVYSLALALWSLREVEPININVKELSQDIEESPDRITAQFYQYEDEIMGRDFLNPPTERY